MLFRLVLISLVLGATILVSWLSDVDLSAPNSLVLFGIIATTYLLTIVYSMIISRIENPRRLADVQLVIDLIISALLVHVTGGAQSAYTFFFPLSIIAAAIIRFRAGAVIAALVSMALFSAVSVLGWLNILPSFAGLWLLPSELSSIQLGRAMALNLAAFAGVAVLAYTLGGQILQTSVSLETQRTATADLRALHNDIIRCLSSGLITVDARGAILTMNRAACEILDVTEEQAVGTPVEDILPGLLHALTSKGQSESLRRGDLTVRRTGKSDLTLGISLSPLRNNQDIVIGLIITFQDLTELRKMEAQMRQAERLAVIGTLAAGVAHEIRNPLAAISGSIELLHVDSRADDDSRALMDIVTREVDRLNLLITELLDYTNPQPRHIVCFDLVELARETLVVFEQDRNLGNISVAITEDSDPGPIEINADPSKVRQVLWNLLRNAAEAARARVHLRILPEEDGATIELRDDGPGIAPEHLERIFDPFFTTKTRGSGLGLATCHSIITELGGEITVDSTPGHGCCFRVRLLRGQERHEPGAADLAMLADAGAKA